jgi:hypothetical protein
MLAQPLARLRPTLAQLRDYTDGQVLPPIRCVEFRPGKGRGRPRKGHEKIVVESVEDVRRVLRDGDHKKYRQITVTFDGDCHHFPAQVEVVYEKLMLVIKDLGIVCSVSVSDPL